MEQAGESAFRILPEGNNQVESGKVDDNRRDIGLKAENSRNGTI